MQENFETWQEYETSEKVFENVYSKIQLFKKFADARISYVENRKKV